jgi:hypothetical protein
MAVAQPQSAAPIHGGHMTKRTPTITTLAAATVLVALTWPADTRAQIATTPPPSSNLNLKESAGGPKGYAFLLPIVPGGKTPEVALILHPDSTLPIPEDWTWHIDTTDAAIKSAVTFKWFAQASCPDDLTLLKVVGPAGTLTQSPLHNPIWGYFNTQSFTVDTLKNVCLDWANSNKCDIFEPGCDAWDSFSLVGGVNPATSADRLTLKASCASGPLPNQVYAASLSLRCSKEP